LQYFSLLLGVVVVLFPRGFLFTFFCWWSFFSHFDGYSLEITFSRSILLTVLIAFSALTLLVGRQEEHLL